MALTEDGGLPSAGARLGALGQWKMAAKPGLIRWASAALVLAAAFGAWEATVSVKDIPAWKAPAPSGIGQELWESRGLLAGHTWITFREVLAGFGIALGAGVITASLITWSRTLRLVLYPPVVASATIPWIVVAPLLLIWVGYGMQHKVIVVALISFFPIVVNTVDGLGSANPDMVSLLRSMGASRWQIFRKVRIPGSLPSVFTGVRIGVTVAVIGAVVGEWVGSSEGLGYLALRSKSQFLSDRVYASIFLLSAMGIGLFLLARVIERLALPWRYDRGR